MHAGLAGVEHVLEVVLQQGPLVEVVLPALLARDDDALHVLGREDGMHLREVRQVGLDVRAFVLGELERLLGDREFFAHASTPAGRVP